VEFVVDSAPSVDSNGVVNTAGAANF